MKRRRAGKPGRGAGGLPGLMTLRASGDQNHEPPHFMILRVSGPLSGGASCWAHENGMGCCPLTHHLGDFDWARRVVGGSKEPHGPKPGQ